MKAKTIRVLIILFPIIFGILIVSVYGVNVVFWDEWELVKMIHEIKINGISFSQLFALHNEHRIFFPTVILLSAGVLTHWNVKVNMFISQFLLAFVYVLCIKTIDHSCCIPLEKNRKSMPEILCKFLVGMCIFSAVQYENFLWGFQVGFVLVAVSAVSGFYFAQKTLQDKSIASLILCLLFGVISTFSSAQGLMVWAVYAGMMILMFLAREKPNLKFFGIVFLVGCLSIFAYMKGFVFVVGHSALAGKSICAVLRYFLAMIGTVSGLENFTVCVWIGATECLLAIGLTCYLLKTGQVSENFFPLGMVYYSFAACLLIAVGRAGDASGILPASRYTTFSLFSLVGVLLIAFREILVKRKEIVVLRYLALPCTMLLCLGMLTTSMLMLDECRAFRAQRSEIADTLKNYASRPYEMLRQLYPWGAYLDAYRDIQYLEQYQFNVFHIPGGSCETVSEAILDERDRIYMINAIGFDENSIKWDDEYLILPNSWAADFVNGEDYLSVFVRVNGALYSTVDHLERKDVAEVFSNENFTYSGFRFWISRSELHEGENPISVVMLLNDSVSYYETDPLMVNLQSDSGELLLVG